MISLLDVNLLVALFDPAHVAHELAHDWFGRGRHTGWATCPITENGLVRVLANPAYPGRRLRAEEALRRLAKFRASGGHSFWAADFSLCDEGVIEGKHLLGHRQLTDSYLLALAVRRAGRFATFDGGVSLSSVPGAQAEHLVVLRG